VNRDEMIERYLPLARSLAGRYRATDEPFEDLVQVASVGLVNAVDRFDPSRGTAFSSFAVPTILGELRRHFRDRTWAMRVPRDRQELYLKLERARDALTMSLGRQPTLAELAERVGASSEEVLQAMELNAAYRADPLEATDPEEDTDRMPGTIDDGYQRAEDRVVLDTLLRTLAPLDAEIVLLRFHEDLTQDAIAQRVGVSQMHVSRVLRRSLIRLREAARSAGPAVRGRG
jgi:RNA polymerase sigma-B factor